MSYLKDFLCDPKNRFEINQKQRAINLIDDFINKTIVTDGVVRWNSNNSVPPTEILDLWQYAKLDFDYDKSVKAKDIDTKMLIANYKEGQAKKQYSEEELLEMSCAFGKGATVVDVITGEKIIL